MPDRVKALKAAEAFSQSLRQTSKTARGVAQSTYERKLLFCTCGPRLERLLPFQQAYKARINSTIFVGWAFSDHR